MAIVFLQVLTATSQPNEVADEEARSIEIHPKSHKKRVSIITTKSGLAQASDAVKK
jgi:hypothetical protein